MQNAIRGAAALVVFVGLAGEAGARIQGITSFRGGDSPRFALRGGSGYTGSGFEVGEGFGLGDVNGQGGWSTLLEGDWNVATPGASSSQSLRGTRSSTTVGHNSLALAVSPNTSNPNAVTQADFDSNIDDNGGANYFVAGTIYNPGTDEYIVSWQVVFDFGGNIWVTDVSGLVDTGVAWAGGAWKHVQVDITSTTLQYWYDGAVIHSGGFVNPPQYGTEQLVVGHDTYQDFSLGSFSEGPVAGYFDNIALTIPTPGALALLSLGGLMVSRRRRA